MNERIRALAHEAGLPTYNPSGIPTKLEKFAELLIRECTQVVDENVSVSTLERGILPSDCIHRHFEVKK
jgi:hypothetical protein